MKNTKSRKHPFQNSDRQQVLLSILLIITCVCLIMSVLIISFFIYREIDRSAAKLKDGEGEIQDKLKGELKPEVTARATTLGPPKTVTNPLKTGKYILLARRTTLPEISEEDDGRLDVSLRTTKDTTSTTEAVSVSDISTIIHESSSSKTMDSTKADSKHEDIIFPESASEVEEVIIKKSTEETTGISTISSVTSSTRSPITTSIDEESLVMTKFEKRLTTTAEPSLKHDLGDFRKHPKTDKPFVKITETTFEKTTEPFEISSAPIVDTDIEGIPLNRSTTNETHAAILSMKPDEIFEPTESILSPAKSATSEKPLPSIPAKSIPTPGTFVPTASEKITTREKLLPSIPTIDPTKSVPTPSPSVGSTIKLLTKSKLKTDKSKYSTPSSKKTEISPEFSSIVTTSEKITIRKEPLTSIPTIDPTKSITTLDTSVPTPSEKITTKEVPIARKTKETPSEKITTKEEPIVRKTEITPFENITTKEEPIIRKTKETFSGKILFPEDLILESTTIMSTSSPTSPTTPTTAPHSVKTVEEIPKTIIKYIEKDPPPPIKTCDTITCKRSASKMIALIDHNLDPCEDFYSYACRGIEVNRLRNPQYDHVIMEKLEDMESVDGNTLKLKQFLDSCKTFNLTEGLITLRKLVKEIFQKSDKGDKRDSLTKVIMKILLLDPPKFNSGLLPMFDFTMELEADGSFIPTVTVPSVKDRGMIDAVCITNLSRTETDEKNVHILYDQYKTCVKNIPDHVISYHNILQKLSEDPLPATVGIEKILKNLEKVPRGINKREWNENIQKGTDKPTYFTIKDLHEKYPEINWAILLHTLFQDKASKVTKVRINFKDYFDNLIKFYRENSLSDLTFILRLIFAHDLFLEIIGEYDKWHVKEYCARKAIHLMDDLAAKMLISKTSRKDLELLEETANDLFSNIKAQFKGSIQNSSWFGDLHKKTILAKLEELTITASTNNLWFNDRLLNYRNEKILITTEYVSNILNIKRNKRRLIYNRIDNDPSTQSIFFYNPLLTEVLTIPEQNRIILPLGFLRKLAYKKRRAPQLYELYAQLGFQIAKGIAKFFEPSELIKLLPGIEENEVYKNYLHIRLGDPQVAKTINKYEIVAIKEDLALSRNSRFIDDMAVRLSMDTYNKTLPPKDLQFLWLNYTIPQLFYLSVAQEFCKPEESVVDMAVSLYENENLPNYFKVNSFLMNSIGFSDVYHCPLGSSMNPPFKADAFPYITYTEIDYV